MNTRGLVELIVLNMGLDAHIISPTVFDIMVIMAIITTIMTTPLVSFFYPPSCRKEEEEQEGEGLLRKHLEDQGLPP